MLQNNEHKAMKAMKCIHFVLAGLDKEWATLHVFVAIYLRKLPDVSSSSLFPASTGALTFTRARRHYQTLKVLLAYTSARRRATITERAQRGEIQSGCFVATRRFYTEHLY